MFGSCCSSRFTPRGADGRSSGASRTRCHFGCARAQALACLVCMCAPARSAVGAGMQRFGRGRLVRIACGHSRDDIASLAQWRRAPAYEAGGRRFDPFTRRQMPRSSLRTTDAWQSWSIAPGCKPGPHGTVVRIHQRPPHQQRPVGLPVRSSALQAEEAGSTPARDARPRSLSSSSRFDGRKPAATIGRRRNPSPTTIQSIRG